MPQQQQLLQKKKKKRQQLGGGRSVAGIVTAVFIGAERTTGNLCRFADKWQHHNPQEVQPGFIILSLLLKLSQSSRYFVSGQNSGKLARKWWVRFPPGASLQFSMGSVQAFWLCLHCKDSESVIQQIWIQYHVKHRASISSSDTLYLKCHDFWIMLWFCDFDFC